MKVQLKKIRKSYTLRIEPGLTEEARALKIDVSEVIETALKDAIRFVKREAK